MMIRCRKATLLEPLGRRAFRARLPNGHELTAILTEQQNLDGARPGSGDEVELDISPADFSRGFTSSAA